MLTLRGEYERFVNMLNSPCLGASVDILPIMSTNTINLQLEVSNLMQIRVMVNLS